MSYQSQKYSSIQFSSIHRDFETDRDTADIARDLSIRSELSLSVPKLQRFEIERLILLTLLVDMFLIALA